MIVRSKSASVSVGSVIYGHGLTVVGSHSLIRGLELNTVQTIGSSGFLPLALRADGRRPVNYHCR